MPSALTQERTCWNYVFFLHKQQHVMNVKVKCVSAILELQFCSAEHTALGPVVLQND